MVSKARTSAPTAAAIGTTNPATTTADQFIRGTTGRAADGRLVAVIAVAVAALASGILTVYFATSALRSGSVGARLASQGKPVEAVVTRCEAVSSGIGQLVQFYDCYGSYSVAGRTYEALIGGERTQLSPGDTLQAVGTSGPAPLLALPGSIPRSSFDWLPAAVSGGITAWLGLTSLFLWLRRRRSNYSGPEVPPAVLQSLWDLTGSTGRPGCSNPNS